jgi:hypothetical protein
MRFSDVPYFLYTTSSPSGPHLGSVILPTTSSDSRGVCKLYRLDQRGAISVIKCSAGSMPPNTGKRHTSRRSSDAVQSGSSILEAKENVTVDMSSVYKCSTFLFLPLHFHTHIHMQILAQRATRTVMKSLKQWSTRSV